MIPPTPASLMEEAKERHYQIADEIIASWNVSLIEHHGGAHAPANILRPSIATALHSIQAQTIREITLLVKQMPSSSGRAVLEDIASYAKDKGIEIE